MGEFKSALKAYDLDKALAADSGIDCLIIDVGRDETGQVVPSLARVIERVDHLLHHSNLTVDKLYIIGKWNQTPCEHENKADSGVEELKAGVSQRS
jgi:hypothetical protein